MNDETREEQYLRILISGPKGEEDYEAVKYLKEKGLTESPIQLSNMRDSYGKVKNVMWLGPNAYGLDYADLLRARANHDKTKQVENKKAEHPTERIQKQVTDRKTESPLVKIAIGIAILVLFGLVAL